MQLSGCGAEITLLCTCQESQGGEEGYQARLQAFVQDLKSLPVAVQTRAANEQHYEVPTSYFLLCLGKRLKYSSCLYPGLNPSTSLDDAEEAMLGATGHPTQSESESC